MIAVIAPLAACWRLPRCDTPGAGGLALMLFSRRAGLVFW